MSILSSWAQIELQALVVLFLPGLDATVVFNLPEGGDYKLAFTEVGELLPG